MVFLFSSMKKLRFSRWNPARSIIVLGVAAHPFFVWKRPASSDPRGRHARQPHGASPGANHGDVQCSGLGDACRAAWERVNQWIGLRNQLQEAPRNHGFHPRKLWVSYKVFLKPTLGANCWDAGMAEK